MTKNNSTFIATTVATVLLLGQKLIVSYQDTDGAWRRCITSPITEVYFLGNIAFKVITKTGDTYFISAPNIDKSSLAVYNGGTESWAASLPSDTLKAGCVYKIGRCEQHDWHTDLYLAGLGGPYNSVWFDSLEDNQGQTAAKLATTGDEEEYGTILPNGNILIK